jgi:hypothetical protein
MGELFELMTQTQNNLIGVKQVLKNYDYQTVQHHKSSIHQIALQ